MEMSLKSGFVQIFSRCPKKFELPKIWGGCSPLAPPGPYAYVCLQRDFEYENGKQLQVTIIKITESKETNPYPQTWIVWLNRFMGAAAPLAPSPTSYGSV